MKDYSPVIYQQEPPTSGSDNLKSIVSVISDFDFFAAPKWKITSDRQGSGNTANIGSINDIEDLKSGNGVFSKLGEKWFDEYWMNYGSSIMLKGGKTIKVTNIWDFLEYRGRADLFNQIVAKGRGEGKNENICSTNQITGD